MYNSNNHKLLLLLLLLNNTLCHFSYVMIGYGSLAYYYYFS